MKIEDLEKKINLPKEDFFQKMEEKALILKEKIDKEWDLCDKNKKDCDEVSEIVEEIEKGFQDLISMYSFIPYLDNFIKRKESELYDISKIWISENYFEKMKAHDKKIISIMKNDWSEDLINKEVSMLHFMSGFSASDQVEEGNIFILKGVIREKQ